MDSSEVILIDFHGVLTDGRQSISHRGKYMFDHIHSRDIRAIRELVALGYRVVIVTSSSSEIIKHFADKVGCEIVVARDKSKLEFKNYIAIGDDAWDVPMLEGAQKSFCPADADTCVRVIPSITKLEANGGHGVIAEMIHKIVHL